jgi:hypothetical protein
VQNWTSNTKIYLGSPIVSAKGLFDFLKVSQI